MSEPWLGGEIAAHLGVTKDTVYVWIADKAMPATRSAASGSSRPARSTVGCKRRRGGGNDGGYTPEDLQAGLRLSGLLPQPVSILAVAPHGPDAVTVTYQDGDGAWPAPALPRRRTFTADRDPGQSVAVQRRPAEFRLCRRGAANPYGGLATRWWRCPPARWIRCRIKSKPSVGSCCRAPLRFLLADDPGAGKTIMA